MSKCLYCYHELEEGLVDFHPGCARNFFGSKTAPILPYTRNNMAELARQVIRASTSVTGVQAKMSLNVNRGGKNEPAKFTIVGLWGKYIFKPQSAKYPHLPELEDLTMKMAEVAHIRTARHTLIRLADGELGYLTLRMDRGKKNEKISMLDMCQLTNRLTEHKYYGTYQQLAETIKKYSSYDLLAVLLADPADTEEMAMSFSVGGKKSGFDRNTFMTAFVESGISVSRSEKMIEQMKTHLPEWKELISQSFLPEKMKADYNTLLDKRNEALG